jgi:hypothetical protein
MFVQHSLCMRSPACHCLRLLLLLLLQVTLFIGGVLCSDAELRAALEPFGELLRAFVVTNPQVRGGASIPESAHNVVLAVLSGAVTCAASSLSMPACKSTLKRLTTAHARAPAMLSCAYLHVCRARASTTRLLSLRFLSTRWQPCAPSTGALPRQQQQQQQQA